MIPARLIVRKKIHERGACDKVCLKALFNIVVRAKSEQNFNNRLFSRKGIQQVVDERKVPSEKNT